MSDDGDQPMSFPRYLVTWFLDYLVSTAVVGNKASSIITLGEPRRNSAYTPLSHRGL